MVVHSDEIEQFRSLDDISQLKEIKATEEALSLVSLLIVTTGLKGEVVRDSLKRTLENQKKVRTGR